MLLKARHNLTQVTTAGDVVHEIAMRDLGDGWYLGEVPPAVAEKCLAISPTDYCLVDDIGEGGASQKEAHEGGTVGTAPEEEALSSDATSRGGRKKKP